MKVLRQLYLVSVEDTRLVGGYHVLNVDESVFSTVHLEQLQGLLDQVSEVVALPLRVVDFVAHVQVFGLEQVHDWQDLSVVGHKSLSNGVRARDEGLQDLQGDGNDFWVSALWVPALWVPAFWVPAFWVPVLWLRAPSDINVLKNTTRISSVIPA